MSLTEDEPAVFSAEELLTLDEWQLVAYMKRSACAEALQVESADASASIDIGILLERLANVADGSSEDRRPQRLRAESQSSTNTSLPESEDIESICREELLQNGGRPVAIEILSQTSREQKDLPWLDEPGSGDCDGGTLRAFERQVDRWWEFRKWQIDNRGPAVGYDGLSTYLAAQKLRHSRSGSHDMVSHPTFEETIRREWEMRPKRREVPSNAGFPAYEEAVKRRLGSHNFTREFQLEENPQQQGVWTTWVEYLNFEYWQADRLAALRKSSEPRYRKAWNEFQRLDAPQPSLGGTAVYGSKASSGNVSYLEQQLAKTQAELEGLRQKIDTFIRETKPYRRREEAVRRQNILTQWVLEELHLIEAETAQERTAVEHKQGKALPSKKRKRNEEMQAEVKDIPDDPKSKRSRRDDASGEGTAQPSTRRGTGSSSRATVPTRVTQQLRRTRQAANPPTNAHAASQRSQRSSRRSRATAEQSTSLGQRRSKRLQARLQAANKGIT